MGRTLQRRKPLLVRAGWYSLTALVLLLALSLFAIAGATVKPVEFSDRAAWRDACKLSRYSCVWLSPPYVARAPLGFLLGRYRMGDKYVLVHDQVDGALAHAVAVHEMTHYLQWKHKQWKFTPESRCENEREAFAVSNAVLRRLGETRHLVDWNERKVIYGCP